MLWLDLKHAVDRSGDSFTIRLFQLMLMADAGNLTKLSRAYPVEAEMVNLFRNDCSYANKERSEVDWELLEERAKNWVRVRKAPIGDWP